MRILTARNRGGSDWEVDGERIMEKTKLGATEHESRECWIRLENQVIGKEVEIARRDSGVRVGL